MHSTPLQSQHEIEQIRTLIHVLGPETSIVDFEEHIQLEAVRSTLRLWHDGEDLAGFAYVDDFDNLWFETLPADVCPPCVEHEIVKWGVHCIRERNAKGAEGLSLDSTCRADNPHRVDVLLAHGFIPQDVRSLHYERPLNEPIPDFPLPSGFSIRSARGEEEVEALVDLHRACFGTDHMTVEYRLAMMRSPTYMPELDLLAVAPNGELAALCVCSFADEDKIKGFTDPVGTHADYQRTGLGKALMVEGLRKLKAQGAQTAALGTSSENLPMRNLAEAVGFTCVAEKLWFSKPITWN